MSWSISGNVIAFFDHRYLPELAELSTVPLDGEHIYRDLSELASRPVTTPVEFRRGVPRDGFVGVLLSTGATRRSGGPGPTSSRRTRAMAAALRALKRADFAWCWPATRTLHHEWFDRAFADTPGRNRRAGAVLSGRQVQAGSREFFTACPGLRRAPCHLPSCMSTIATIS